MFALHMATMRNKTKLAAVNRDNHEEASWSNQSQNTIVRGIQEERFTQVSEEMDGRVTRKLFQEFSGTEMNSERSVEIGLFFLSSQV